VYSGRRLLLLPWTTGNRKDIRGGTERNILVAVQPSKKTETASQPHRVTVHVYDYAPWYSNEDERKATYYELYQILQHDIALPSHLEIEANISWITDPVLEDVSQQWKFYCYVMMSAWAVALNLELNPDFRPQENFYDEANMLTSLILDGSADWKLIWSFLRCHQFVKNDQISKERRFDRTVPESMLGRSHSQLQAEAPGLVLAGSPNSSWRALHQGRKHGDKFPSDSWTNKADFHKFIPSLLQRGMRIAHLNQKQLWGWSEIYSNNDDKSSNNETSTQHLEADDRGVVITIHDACKDFRNELKILRKKYWNG
jgi:hypothetical protein